MFFIYSQHIANRSFLNNYLHRSQKHPESCYKNIVFLCAKYYCTKICKRTKLQIFTHFYNQKATNLCTHEDFIYRMRFFYNERRW